MLASSIVVDDNEHNVTLEDGLTAIRQYVPVLGTKSIEITSSRGNVLRQDIISDIDYPTADISAVDGYCFRASDTARASAGAPVMLAVCGTVKAGETASFELAPRECANVMTGAILPSGADAVVRSEAMKVTNDTIVISGPVARWSSVRRAGEVAQKMDVVLREGSVITPAAVGLLAAVGAGRIEASEKPRVGILATGDELVPSGTHPAPGHTRSSNAVMLLAMADELGLPVFDAGISRDDESEIVRHIETCGDCDVVILTGGTAAGRHDLVPAALERAGAQMIFRGLLMQPGRHMLFALRERSVCIGLPGNPVACLVLFHTIVRPTLMAMMGAKQLIPMPFTAKWVGPDRSKPDIRVFTPGRWVGDSEVEPVGSRGSADVVGLAAADCLVSLPGGSREVKHGQPVDVFTAGRTLWSDK
jgi:molybdopterin molybdotransferase